MKGAEIHAAFEIRNGRRGKNSLNGYCSIPIVLSVQSKA
jgi:hypothetical protein